MTPLSEIYDLFLMQVTDYRLTALWDISPEELENYLEGFLVMAIADFMYCKEDLSFDSAAKKFDNELSLEVKVILSTLMRKAWLQKLVNDITQMNLHITDRDFKTASEAMNLREKSTHLNHVKEECSQLLSDYEYKHNDWDSWFAQNFK